jgi:hypothetical protein
MSRINRCVVRNQAYRKGEFNLRERHNERKNECYGNGDIIKERSYENIHFRSCESTYEQEFNRLVESGVVSLHGLKNDAKVFDEMVFDVNSAYFDERGGYRYALEFFKQAYKFATNEIGGEQFVLSAVMHADEKNSALSKELGHDVFHYHLHVVYLPVVDKEIRFHKNHKNPELAGQIKEVIKQVSHSKKWPRFKDADGHWVNSYSLLQDRFYEHMRKTGFKDFERGERGSTSEHLSDLEYKTQKEQQRLDSLSNDIKSKQHEVTDLNNKVSKQESKLSSLKKKTTFYKEEMPQFGEIESMPETSMLSNKVKLSKDDWKKISGLAKEGIDSRLTIGELKQKCTALAERNATLAKRLTHYEGQGITDEIQYFQAQQRAPHRLAEAVAEIMRQPPECDEPARTKKRQKHADHER